jgi:hypothetical protein
MAERRHVNYDRVPSPAKDPLWFPYTPKSMQWMQRGLRVLYAGNGLIQRLSEFF